MKSFLQAKKFDFTETVAGVDEAAPVSEADKKKQEEAGQAQGGAPPPYDPNGPQVRGPPTALRHSPLAALLAGEGASNCTAAL